ncbi:MAG: hypothetical protein FWG45_07635, partial [Oscillospiraceae bacterium]|nr:hypothetical protein [Oscillospiraceae bacterium]
MNAKEFLEELKSLQLTGREFLALIGHTAMSNEDYTEIKQTPAMTHERLIEILTASPITGAEYAGLLATARMRQEKQSQKQKRDELEQKLSAILSGSEPEPPSVEPESFSPPSPTLSQDLSATSDISLDEITALPTETYYETPQEELWGEEITDNAEDVLTDPQYGGKDDFDRNAASENFTKTVLCLSLAFVLAFSSFFIRYLTTGEWFMSDLVDKSPQSYAELFELQQSRNIAAVRENSHYTPYKAERFADAYTPLATVTASNTTLFRVSDNDIQAVSVNAGIMEDAPTFISPIARINGELLGLFVHADRLYAVYSELYQTNMSYTHEVTQEETTIVSDTSIFTQPRVKIYEFDANNYTSEPLTVYEVDGLFREVLIHEQGVLIITDYTPKNTYSADELIGYVPSYGVNGSTEFVQLRNIKFVPGANHSNMVVLFNIVGEGSIGAVTAISGNTADCVYYSDDAGWGALFMTFYNVKANRTHVTRFDFQKNILAWESVSGRVPQGFVDERGGYVRIVSDSGSVRAGATLFMFDENMKQIGNALKNIASNSDSGILGAAFDSDTVYVIGQKTYAINTANPSAPMFSSEVNALIMPTDGRYFYEWGDVRFFEVQRDL